MESWPQNPKFRNNPENFRPCMYKIRICIMTVSSALKAFTVRVNTWNPHVVHGGCKKS